MRGVVVILMGCAPLRRDRDGGGRLPCRQPHRSRALFLVPRRSALRGCLAMGCRCAARSSSAARRPGPASLIACWAMCSCDDFPTASLRYGLNTTGSAYPSGTNLRCGFLAGIAGSSCGIWMGESFATPVDRGSVRIWNCCRCASAEMRCSYAIERRTSTDENLQGGDIRPRRRRHPDNG